ncbi:MAG TPA: PfkB family carbohydrate kinase [Gammaproteobacteria bacterium]|nr:PfkB family carbohydrate kinase [Gammaproteobacteria bacterium]
MDPGRFHWLHFEGRNVPETRRMLRRVREVAPRVACSVEIEKPRPGIESLYADADLLLFSRAYARHAGYDDPLDLLEAVRGQTPAEWLVCAWGAEGAAALDRRGGAVRSDAVPPARVVDTLGAGDVFNAAVIDGLVRGWALEETLPRACRLAGQKCGQWGLSGMALT